MNIHSNKPFRINFGGGGTDLPPYYTEHGGYVINVTIDRHVYINLNPREDKNIRVYSVNYEKEKLFKIGDKDYSEEFEIFKGTVNFLGVKDDFDIIIYSELPYGSRMVGLSSLTAFNEYYNLRLFINEIAQKAWDIESVELKQKSVYQDQIWRK